MIRAIFVFLTIVLFFVSCSSDLNQPKEAPASLFKSLPTSQTKVNFRNSITETQDFNFITYLNMYNGGGVAIGDINNDGLEDIYFSANQGDNKLYLNQGGMVFKDITDKAGVHAKGGWTTGTSMVDINNDGLLDIYVCRSGSLKNKKARKNIFYINQGDNTFKDQASLMGLADSGFSNQSYFFDYDKDGDLDMFLIGHRVDFENTIVLSAEVSQTFVPDFSDRLFRNDGGRFTDVSRVAGITSKTWGHSASIYDFNEDGYLDIYVCNDFLEPDLLWINNKKGGFTNEILTFMDHISFYSMGSDVADINNDGRADLMVLDMVSEDHARSKQNMPGMSTEQFNVLVDNNYHHQYMANMLHINMGQGRYSEIANLAGVSNTDWSWAPLLADFDNDGLRDMFITNGIKRDMTDNDYKNELNKRNAAGPISLEEIFQMAPSSKQQNYFYHNNGNTTFTKKNDEWGFSQKLFSNGAAYADLDNDGDLDLVVNNLEDFATIYENQSVNNFLKLEFEGSAKNKMGLGAEVRMYSGDDEIYYQHFLNRGYLSSMGSIAILGLGNKSKVDRLVVSWPDGNTQTLTDLKANKKIRLKYSEAKEKREIAVASPSYVQEIVSDDLTFAHKENLYDDFRKEILLPYKLSTMGPDVTGGDVNGDGIKDFYLSGSSGIPGILMVQDASGNFTSTNESVWSADKRYEDMGSSFFDADGDGDLDLYVVSGSNEQEGVKAMYQDRLYLNNGKGVFSKSSSALPKITSSGSVVVPSDIDKDGDIDLFVGGRLVPGKYPLAASSMILQNNKGKFIDVTKEIAPDLDEIGMVTDGVFSDYDSDGDQDIMLVGEWMSLVIMENDNGKFSKKEMSDISGKGWFYHINKADLDGDGDDDYILGNLGLNNKFRPKEDKPFHVYCDDFDQSGNLDIVLSKESKGKLLPVRGRECSSQQMPFIKDKFPTFKSFAQADLNKIYGDLENAVHYEATTFENMIIMNDGSLGLRKVSMPIEAQYGPTLSSIVLDINGDGILDIIGAGNIYNTEVETIRYDGSKGYILLGSEDGSFRAASDTGLYLGKNTKDMELYKTGDKERLMVVNNNGPIQWFEIKS